MEQVLDFLRRLHDNNDREWFDAHRAEWTRVKGCFADFTQRLIDGIASFDDSVRGLRPQDCTYRIARDTRFSADKTPYKNYISAFIAPRGKQSGYAGYYLHVEPSGDGLLGGSQLGGGVICLEPVVLRSVREEMLDNGAEVLRAVSAARGFRLWEGNKLKRVPTGFPSDSEYAELLKLKDFYVERPLDEKELLRSDAVERLVGQFRLTQPFVAILNRAIRYAHEEMM